MLLQQSSLCTAQNNSENAKWSKIIPIQNLDIHEFTFSKSIANFDLFIWNIPIKYKADLISEECYIDICQLLCPYVQVNAVQTTGEHFPRAVSPGSGGRFLMPLRHFVAAPLLYLLPIYLQVAGHYLYTYYIAQYLYTLRN